MAELEASSPQAELMKNQQFFGGPFKPNTYTLHIAKKSFKKWDNYESKIIRKKKKFHTYRLLRQLCILPDPL